MEVAFLLGRGPAFYLRSLPWDIQLVVGLEASVSASPSIKLNILLKSKLCTVQGLGELLGKLRKLAPAGHTDVQAW